MKVSAPSNIAFIKYWGKQPPLNDQTRNLATNSSLSMTLTRARSIVEIRDSSESRDVIEVFGAPAKPKDQEKIVKHVERICAYLEITNRSPLLVKSDNTFPAGTGLASSASSFAALTFALIGHFKGRSFLESSIKTQLPFLSALARRGSGSAARSVCGPYMLWDGPSARAIPCHWKLYDTVLMLSKVHKAVPSSEGHLLAMENPEFSDRIKRLPARTAAVLEALDQRSISRLGPLIEEEALEMHQMSRTAPNPVDYLLPSTKTVLHAVQNLKSRNFFFTLDAGPNIHFISETPIKSSIEDLLRNLNIKSEIWEDEAGIGPELL